MIHSELFIGYECGSLIGVNDGGELTRNINQKKKLKVLQQPIDVHGYWITISNRVNKLGKHDLSEPVANNLKGGNFFSDQMNRNRFDPVFARSIWNCFTM